MLFRSNADTNKPFEVQASVDLKVATENLLVNIKNSKGEVVKEINLGARSPGKIDFKWDGQIVKDNAFTEGSEEVAMSAPGSYKIEAYADVDKEKQAAETYVYDMVDSVSVGHAGQPMTLNLTNAGQAKMSEVLKIM